MLSKHNINTPNFLGLKKNDVLLNKEKSYHNIKNFLGLPFILKPINMGGTVGVKSIKNYKSFYRYFQQEDCYTDLIAEEFIDGQLYHCDFIFQNNETLFSEVSEYLWNGLSFLNGKNHGSIILQKENLLKLEIIDFCKNANSKLGLKSGCVHFEVFVKNNKEIVFLEAAARPAGSMVPVVFNEMFQTNFLNNALLAEIGEETQRFADLKNYYFWILLAKQQGIISEIKEPSLRSSYKINWNVELNDHIKESTSIFEKSGSLIANNNNYEILKEDFNIFKTFKSIVTN